MNHASFFSGIGGFDLAAEWMGWNNVLKVEIDPFCRRVLKHHFPNAEQHTDIRTFDGSTYRGTVDIVSGGFPCQPYSVAGKRNGNNDDRALWPEMLRVIREIQPLGLLVKTLLESSVWYNPKASHVWKARNLPKKRTSTFCNKSLTILNKKDTPSKHLLFQLVPLVHSTDETGFGLLQTVTTGERIEEPEKMRARAKRNGYTTTTKYNGLASQVAHMAKVKGFLPTPTASDSKNASLPPSQKDSRKGMNGTIPSALLHLGSSVGTRIHPSFYERLMGYPEGWLDVPTK